MSTLMDRFRLSILLVTLALAVGVLPAWSQSDDSDGRPIDIIILKDESLSMRTTDPEDLRDQAVHMLADELQLAGGDNRVALVLFGTSGDITVGLGSDVASLRAESSLHYPPRAPLPNPFSSLGATPKGGFTDFYLGLKRAAEILETTSDGSERDRYVVVLTDGRIQPWPGHDRFADLKGRYRDEVLSQPEGMRQQASDSFSDRHCADRDRQRIQEELLPKYRRNNWRIHAIGFHSAVQKDFLHTLAKETGGDMGTVDNAHEMASLLDDMLPAFRNVIRFRDIDLCGGNVNESVFIPPVGALSFRFSFSTLNGRILPTPEQVEVTLESPDGRKYSSADANVFRQYRNRKGQLLQLTAQFQAPRKGQWLVRVRGIGMEPCGLLRIAANRQQSVAIDLNPDTDLHAPGSDLMVQTSLIAPEGPLPLAGASAELLRKGQGVVSAISLSASDSTRHSATVRLPEVEDTYEIRVKLIDALTGAVVTGRRQIQVKEQLCGVRLQPSRLDLGVIGGDLARTERQEVSVLLDCQAPAEITVDKPELTRRGVTLPVEWLHVDPLVGTYSPAAGAHRIGVWMELPSALPSDIVSGEYTGKLVIRSPSFNEEYQELEVRVRVDVPELVLRPDELEMSFSKQLSATLESGIQVKLAGGGTHDVRINYSGELYCQDIGSGRVRFELIDSRGRELPPNGGQSLSVSQRSGVDLIARVWLDDPLLRDEGTLDPDTRVPAGVYEGRIEVYGDRLASQDIDVIVTVPEASWSMLIREWLPKVLRWFGIAVGLLVLLLVGLRIFRSAEVERTGVTSEFEAHSVEGVIQSIEGAVRVRIVDAEIGICDGCARVSSDAVSSSGDVFEFEAVVDGRPVSFQLTSSGDPQDQSWDVVATRDRTAVEHFSRLVLTLGTAALGIAAVALIVARVTIGSAL